MRQCGFITLYQTNAFLAYDYFVNKQLDEQERGTKADFTRMLAKELIENDIWVREMKNKEKKSRAEGTQQNSWKRIENMSL